MPQNPQPRELTLKSGKKVKFTRFNGKINFDNGVETVDRLTRQEQRQIENLYKDVSKNVRKEIELLKNKEGKTATDRLQLMRLQELEKSVDERLQEITAITETTIKTNMKLAAAAVTYDATKWLNSYGIGIKTSYPYVPQSVVLNITTGRLYGKDWQFSKRIWGDYNKSVSDITRIVAEGVAQSKSSYDIAKDLEKYVNPAAAKPWDWSKVYPHSKKKIDYNAQRLARTMVGHAYQQSVIEVSKSNPFVAGIQWISVHTKTTCEICEALDGQIFDVDKVPLDHPNGKCTFAAVIRETPEQIADKLYEWYIGETNDEFDKKMDLFAEKAGFNKGDINLDKLNSRRKRK